MHTQEKTQKIIARIQQLRAISQSTHSRAEAETTLAIAANLIAQYQLDEAMIQANQPSEGNIDDPVDLDTESIIYESGRLNPWKSELASGIAHLNGLFIYNAIVRGGISHRKQNRYRVIGRKSDVAFSLYMMDYLVGEISRLADLAVESRGKRGVNPERESWSLGCVRGFLDKMKKEREAVNAKATSTALVLLENKSKEAERLFREKTNIVLGRSTYQSKARRDYGSYAAGYERGKDLSVNPGIGTSSKSASKLLR